MKRRIIKIIIIIVLLSFIFIFINEKFKYQAKLYKPKVVHNIKFSNLRIKKKNNNYIVKIKLSAKKDVNIDYFDIEFRDKKNDTLDIVSGNIGSMKKGEQKVLELSSSSDLKEAKEAIYTVYN